MDAHRNRFLEIFHAIDFQKIKDHPNILIAAAFWEEDRYRAAKLCYQCLRTIDDLIDDHKAEHKKISPEERAQFMASVDQWLVLLRTSGQATGFQGEIAQAFKKFSIPLWTMEAFARSMIYDIDHDGFPTLEAFLEYSKGASVAPASIFVHLAGLTRQGDSYGSPAFEVREAATPCAIFSYLVHIIRDFRKDQLNNLTYFPDDLIRKHGLTRDDLRRFAEGHPVNRNFRDLIRELCAHADHYRRKTYEVIDRISPLLEPRYRLSLEIIFSLYVLVFEKIDLEKGQFTTEELNPTPEETRERVLRTIQEFSPGNESERE